MSRAALQIAEADATMLDGLSQELRVALLREDDREIVAAMAVDLGERLRGSADPRDQQLLCALARWAEASSSESPSMTLTPLAVSHAALLRAMRDHPGANAATLADAADRVPNNIARDLAKLEGEALVDTKSRTLTPAGLDTVAALDRAAGVAGAAPLIVHGQILPDPDNPRKDFDSDEARQALGELAASIAKDGLLENLVVRPLQVPMDDGSPRFMLIAGERRWRAIGLAIEQGAWLPETPIPTLIKDIDEAAARRIALVENLQRRDLKPLEEARALQQLVQLDGRKTVEIAEDLGFTQRWAQQRLQLLNLSPALQERLEAGALRVEEARVALSIWPRLPADRRQMVEAGLLSVMDAKRWVDELPEPLTAAARLVLAEAYDAVKRRPYEGGGYGGGSTEVQAATIREEKEGHTKVTTKIADPIVATLIKRQMLQQPGIVYEEGVETGRHYVSFSYWADDRIKAELPEILHGKKRPGLIAALRVEVLGEEKAGQIADGDYATAWLNGPFETDPTVIDEIARKREAREARDAEWKAQRQAAAAQRAEEEAERERRARDLKARAPQLREALAAQPNPSAVVALATDMGVRLPLHMEANGRVTDADGREVVDYCWNENGRLGRLMLVAICNAVADLEMPADPADELDEDAPSEAEFIEAVAGCLMEGDDDITEEAAKAKAAAGLAAFLEDEGVPYAAVEYDWDETGAQALAQGIRDGLGQGEEVEGQDDDTGDDGEISPALARLAGAEGVVA